MKLTNNQLLAGFCGLVSAVALITGTGFVAIICLLVLLLLWNPNTP